jgi:hypothetical protein
MRVHVAAALGTVALCLLQACGHSAVPSGTSLPVARLTSPLGVVSVTSTTARVLALSNSAPGAGSSQSFRVAPHARVAYVWSCPNSGSPFRVRLLSHSSGGSRFDELVRVGRHGMEGSLGSRSWRNDGKQVGGHRTFPVMCSVNVTATRSPWSLILLVGGHSQLKFASSTLGFSLSYDPAVCDFNAIGITPRMSRALHVQAGTGVSLLKDDDSYGFSLITTNDHPGRSGRMELRAITSGRPGRRSVISQVHTGHASGYQQLVTQRSGTTVYMVLSMGGRDYQLVGFYDTRGTPRAKTAFSRLLSGILFMQ